MVRVSDITVRHHWGHVHNFLVDGRSSPFDAATTGETGNAVEQADITCAETRNYCSEKATRSVKSNNKGKFEDTDNENSSVCSNEYVFTLQLLLFGED